MISLPSCIVPQSQLSNLPLVLLDCSLMGQQRLHQLNDGSLGSSPAPAGISLNNQNTENQNVTLATPDQEAPLTEDTEQV